MKDLLLLWWESYEQKVVQSLLGEAAYSWWRLTKWADSREFPHFEIRISFTLKLLELMICLCVCLSACGWRCAVGITIYGIWKAYKLYTFTPHFLEHFLFSKAKNLNKMFCFHLFLIYELLVVFRPHLIALTFYKVDTRQANISIGGAWS